MEIFCFKGKKLNPRKKGRHGQDHTVHCPPPLSLSHPALFRALDVSLTLPRLLFLAIKARTMILDIRLILPVNYPNPSSNPNSTVI